MAARRQSLHKPRLAASGFTLLEVLIALSIFALVGVASFRVLTSVIDSQSVLEQRSAQLLQLQKALQLIDQDLQQLVDRPVRISATEQEEALLVAGEVYPLQFTRGGWRNPLQLARSSQQRVAYDIGPHPQAEEEGSPFFGDERQWLRRWYWLALDRPEGAEPLVQPLLADVEELSITVMDQDYLRHGSWPVAAQTGAKPKVPVALEIVLKHVQYGELSRVYKVR